MQKSPAVCASQKKKVMHRLRIMQGHLKAIERMVDEGAYCIDVLHQSSAVQRALRKFDTLVMEDHIRGCIAHQVKNGQEDKMVQDLLSIYKFV